MRITLNLKKSLEENAGVYFDKAKKAKKKIEGIKEALARFEKEKKQSKKKEERRSRGESQRVKPKTLEHWYEKFRWFKSSEGLLCVGGRDATTNDILVKKQTLPDEHVFHTELPGSPFFIVKSEIGKSATEKTLEEVAQATASYSRAWKERRSEAEVFRVLGEQLSKTAESGEYVAKGAFVVRGKRQHYNARVVLAIGITREGQIIGGPVNAIHATSKTYLTITQGEKKASDAAKEIKKALGYTGHLDDIIRFLPSGKIHVEKKRK